MKQIVASVFFDILSYTIGNIIFCISFVIYSDLQRGLGLWGTPL